MKFNLMDKIENLKEIDNYACWYITRQKLDFLEICYAVSILEEFKESSSSSSLKDFFKTRVNELKREERFRNFSSTHRMLNNAYYFGLLRQTSSTNDNYIYADPTQVYYTIYERCNGNFNNVDLYSDIIERQIEKIFISSTLDKQYDGIRRDYRLYPLFLLYKVLIEIGQITGEYKISKEEFRIFVTTTKSYKDYLSTVFYILEKRNKIDYEKDNNYIAEYNEIKNKFSNRINLVLYNLKHYFNFDSESISLKSERIGTIKKKVYQFEMSSVDDSNYLDLLCSNRSLIPQEYPESVKNIDDDLKSNKFNRLVFGAPGTGKSHLLDEDADRYFKSDNVERITFHRSMSNGQFVGTYKPRPKKDNKDLITYEYVPGVFTRQLVEALKNPSEDYLIIIEELNRADAPAVFGDIFQLLDRDEDGNSKYPIAIPEDMYDYLAKNNLTLDGLVLPFNFYIWSTMNTADQGVQPLDASFTRRFDQYEYISINNNEEQISDYFVEINGIGTVNWNDFRKKLNQKLLELNVKEDKLIGTFFIQEKILKDPKTFQETFKNKLIFYLAETIFKHNKSKFFVENSFNNIIESYNKDNNIFNFEFDDLI